MKSFQLALFFTLVLGSLACTDFKEFILFPNPIQVGQTAYISAVVPLTGLQGTVTSGTIKLSVQFNDDDEALQVANIPLCDSTPSIVCSSLRAGDNALSFHFDVPEIPIGIYTIHIEANVGTWGSICHDVILNVTDPKQVDKTQFYSFIQAQVSATAQYENSNIQYRTIGDAVQIGPIGYAPAVYSSHYEWGKFLSISGTQDVVKSNLDFSNFVWGLYGNLSEITYSSTARNHTYTGVFYVGYVSDLTSQTTDFTIADGTFSLTWSYKIDGTGAVSSILVGSVHFGEDYGTLPSGWSAPITVEKYGTLYVSTDSHGILTLSGNKTYCYAGADCTSSLGNIIAGDKAPSTGLSDVNIILIICLTVGVTLLVVLVVVMFLYMRRRKRFEEEDGIFSATRKPEYGNALVVDDIIQETREHGASPIIPNLDRHPGDTYDDDSDDFSEDESELDHGRKSRFSREAGSPSRRRSPSIERRGERGSGHRRSNRSRSNSPDRRRSMSPPRKDDESSYYSDAGSSASRVSSDDE